MAMKFQVLLCVFALFQLSVGLSMESLNEVEQSPEREKKNVPEGSCQSHPKLWHKPGTSVRCSCMKCTCAGGKWNCAYAFEYCPYYTCGSVQYSPNTELCCCGKVFTALYFSVVLVIVADRGGWNTEQDRRRRIGGTQMKFRASFCFALGIFLTTTNGFAIEKSDAATEFESVTVVTQSDIREEEQKKIQAGYCHWEHNVWHKPEESVQCNCLNCTCADEGKWSCEYSFEYCPYYYCDKELYSPKDELCCCNKLHVKITNYACCGSFYYNPQTSKCCDDYRDYSVKPKSADCSKSRRNKLFGSESTLKISK
ncbi:Hypothetical predicted protein [Paramuricea clavata]|uniref:Uncharacterized protein n=1 Tax=Paramuricea clavata TaxID=317549 RepID=A0A7D9HP79_PARCT|nr:Hypothetical predicted protein [Paramuricea clavata]